MDRILSIQSHVVSGYVGNRAAVFPLQTLGFDVDVVNTVQYSNHTGYGHTDGHKTTPEQLEAIFEGLSSNGLLTHDRVLTGYIPSAESLQVVARQVQRLSPSIYVLDPVMGDIGTGLYVAPDVVPVYKSMLSTATIVTPNQFEVELLSGVKITSFPSLHEALDQLHRDVPHVALSSIPLPVAMVEALGLPLPPAEYTRLLPDPLPRWYNAVGLGDPEDDVLVCFASTRDGETWAYALPTIDGYFSGVGDLFSAMVLAHFSGSLAGAVSRALIIVQQILLRTHLHSLSHSGSGAATPRPLRADDSVLPTDHELDAAPLHPKRKARRMRIRELRVVSERALLLEPSRWPGKRVDWAQLI